MCNAIGAGLVMSFGEGNESVDVRHVMRKSTARRGRSSSARDDSQCSSTSGPWKTGCQRALARTSFSTVGWAHPTTSAASSRHSPTARNNSSRCAGSSRNAAMSSPRPELGPSPPHHPQYRRHHRGNQHLRQRPVPFPLPNQDSPAHLRIPRNTLCESRRSNDSTPQKRTRPLSQPACLTSSVKVAVPLHLIP